MMAFLSGPPPIPLNTPGRQARSVCRHRPPIPRQARVVFSALIDEKKALSEPESNNLTDAPNLRTDEEQNQSPDSFQKEPRAPQPPRAYSPNRSRNNFARPRFEADPDATYYTKCSKCFAAYELDPSVLGTGKKVACSVCANEWFQKPERLYTLRETEEFTEYPMDRKDEFLQRKDRGRYSGRRRDRQPAGRTFSVFIGNLPFSVSEEELKAIISNVVVPKRVAVVVDADGRSKGYAFADVYKGEEVDQLVRALDNTSVKGRNIASSFYLLVDVISAAAGYSDVKRLWNRDTLSIKCREDDAMSYPIAHALVSMMSNKLHSGGEKPCGSVVSIFAMIVLFRV